jgi:hypothetical protein
VSRKGWKFSGGVLRIGWLAPALGTRSRLIRSGVLPSVGFVRAGNDDHEVGPVRALGVEIVEDSPQRNRGLAAHIHDEKQYLLLIVAHTDGAQHQDARGLFIDPRLDDGAVENEWCSHQRGCGHTKRPSLPSARSRTVRLSLPSLDQYNPATVCGRTARELQRIIRPRPSLS